MSILGKIKKVDFNKKPKVNADNNQEKSENHGKCNKKGKSDHGNIKDNQNDGQGNEHKQIGLEIRMPGCENFVPIGRWQVQRIYADDMSSTRFLCILDEVCELVESTGLKTQEGKEEDALKQEIVGLIKSITQLGRSAGMHCVLATQRNDASIIPGVIQNNPLSRTTKLRIRREME